MARYGESFSGGRRNRRNLGDIGIGYDQEYFGPRQGGRQSRPSRSPDWGEMDSQHGRSREGQFGRQGQAGGTRQGGGRGREMGGGFGGRDWRGDFSPAGGRRYASGGGPMGRNDFDEPGPGRFRNSRYDSREFGRDRGRESVGDSWRSSGGGYDRDFGDRVRRGWDRLRHEAREMFDRGYDRGW